MNWLDNRVRISSVVRKGAFDLSRVVIVKSGPWPVNACRSIVNGGEYVLPPRLLFLIFFAWINKSDVSQTWHMWLALNTHQKRILLFLARILNSDASLCRRVHGVLCRESVIRGHLWIKLSENLAHFPLLARISHKAGLTRAVLVKISSEFNENIHSKIVIVFLQCFCMSCFTSVY